MRRFMLITAEQTLGDYGLHWLSFADPGRPAGTQFLGVALIWAKGFVSAVEQARLMGLNPGGEVQGMDFDPDEILPAMEYWNRLLDSAAVERCEADRRRRYAEQFNG